MDVRHELNGTLFVWNDEKARLNILNHEGITFEQAAEVFFDPFLQLEDRAGPGNLHSDVGGSSVL